MLPQELLYDFLEVVFLEKFEVGKDGSVRCIVLDLNSRGERSERKQAMDNGLCRGGRVAHLVVLPRLRVDQLLAIISHGAGLVDGAGQIFRLVFYRNLDRLGCRSVDREIPIPLDHPGEHDDAEMKHIGAHELPRHADQPKAKLRLVFNNRDGRFLRCVLAQCANAFLNRDGFHSVVFVPVIPVDAQEPSSSRHIHLTLQAGRMPRRCI